MFCDSLGLQDSDQRSRSVGVRRPHREGRPSEAQSAEKAAQVTFSFSPYSTKRSRLVELQARLKRDKDTKKRVISEIVAENTVSRC